MKPSLEPVENPAGGVTLKKKAWPQQLLLTLTLITGVATFFNPTSENTNRDALLLLLATASSLAVPVRQLPLQSVLLAAFVIALIGGAAHGLSVRTGLPFGPLIFGATAGPKLFSTVPPVMPLLWIIAIFNSRGVARLMLRPWRRVKNYGFLLMGLTVALALAFDFALEPFAHGKHLWRWQPTILTVTWYGATPLSFLAWAFVALLILALIMPYLIRKQPGNPSAPDFAPLALWLGAIVLFAVNSAHASQWAAVILDAAIAGVAAIYSWLGARW